MDLVRIDAAIASAHHFLRSAFVDEGQNGGYPEIATFSQIRPWGGTADGLLALHQCGEASSSKLIKACGDWLINAQDAQTGGWESRGVAVVDATAMVLVATTLTRQIAESVVNRAADFMLANRVDGGFSPRLPALPCVYSTCLSIWALQVLNEFIAARWNAPAEAGAEWLLTEALDGGGWGFSDDPPALPTVAHTGCALFALSRVGIDKSNPVVKSSFDWLYEQLLRQPDPTLELRRVGESEKEIRTTHLAQAWGVLGLIHQGLPVFDSTVRTCLTEVMGLQDATGGFRCPLPGEPGRRHYVWATGRCVHALISAKELVSAANNLFLIADRVAVLERSQRSQTRSFKAVISTLLVSAAVFFLIASGAYTAIPQLASRLGSGAREVWRSQGWTGVALSLAMAAALGLGGWVWRRNRRSRRTSGVRGQRAP